MATADSAITLRILVQVTGNDPIWLAEVEVPTRVDLVPSLEDDDASVPLVTMPDGWGHELGEALVRIGQGLQGQGRPHLHS